ncbi:MAG: hypothetical protein WCP04_09115 [Pseudomonadota bacterium]
MDVRHLKTPTRTARWIPYAPPTVGAALLYADAGKFKIPGLRGLAAHPPYFNNGAAKTATDVVAFYNTRFNLNSSTPEALDLANFLHALYCSGVLRRGLHEESQRLIQVFVTGGVAAIVAKAHDD